MKMRPTHVSPRARDGALVLVVALVASAACSSSSSSESVADARPPKDAGRDRTSAPDDGGHPDASSSDAFPSEAIEAAAPVDAGAPVLTNLVVKESGDSALTLVPAFSSSIHDYYVRCSPGLNDLEVDLAASTGAAGLVLEPTKSDAGPTETVLVSLAEGDALVAAATRGEAKSTYWIRCLPADFPVLDWQPHPDAGAAPPGYYLVGATSAPSGGSAYAMVLDSNGVPVWYEPSAGGVFDVDTLAAGIISYVAPSSGNSFENHALSPLVTTYVKVAGKPADEHELRALANGDYLVFTSPVVSGVDLTGLSLPTADGGTEAFGKDSTMRGCQIQEVDPSGKIVWQWQASKHFDPVKDMTYLEPVTEFMGATPVVDPFHCDSIDVDTNGNLLVSAANLGSVFYIERSTGTVLWKLGGATYSTDDATFVPVADPFRRQHDARFGASWKSSCNGRSGRGAISLFDDETAGSGRARGVVYDVEVRGEGCAEAGTSGAKVSSHVDGTGAVTDFGSFRVLPTGGRLVGWGARSDVAFTETDSAGKDVLDLRLTSGATSYRALKVPLTSFELEVLHATAGEAAPLPPDAGVVDAGADASPDTGASATRGCNTVTGSGDAEQCTYVTSTAAGFACPADGGATPGSCPSTGLYGCCVHTLATDAGQTLDATCYYSAATGAPAASTCELNAYDGLPYEWQTSAP